MLFLTGATGYVGMRTGERLAGSGRSLRCLVLPADSRDPRQRFPADLVRGDVTDLAGFEGHGAEVTEIVHAASAGPPAPAAVMHDVNVKGTANVIAFARRWGVKRLVHLSAAGDGDGPLASSMAEAERLVAASGLDFTVLRLSMVYGPGGARRFRRLVARLNRIPLVYPVAGEGRARLRPVYVGDVVNAVELVLSAPAAVGRTYPVSGATVVAWRELVDRVAAAEGLRRMRVHLPLSLCRAAAGALALALPLSLFDPGEMAEPGGDGLPDHTAFHDECGYTPLTLEQGLASVFGGGEAVR